MWPTKQDNSNKHHSVAGAVVTAAGIWTRRCNATLPHTTGLYGIHLSLKVTFLRVHVMSIHYSRTVHRACLWQHCTCSTEQRMVYYFHGKELEHPSLEVSMLSYALSWFQPNIYFKECFRETKIGSWEANIDCKNQKKRRNGKEGRVHKICFQGKKTRKL